MNHKTPLGKRSKATPRGDYLGVKHKKTVAIVYIGRLPDSSYGKASQEPHLAQVSIPPNRLFVWCLEQIAHLGHLANDGTLSPAVVSWVQKQSASHEETPNEPA